MVVITLTIISIAIILMITIIRRPNAGRAWLGGIDMLPLWSSDATPMLLHSPQNSPGYSETRLRGSPEPPNAFQARKIR